MPAKVNLNLKVNGKEHNLLVWPLARLLDVLRQEVRLTGTKEGCGEGECGACSILLNRVLVNSCLVPAIQAQGAEVTTVEGIASEERLHAVQQCLITCGGAQCGMCTPGMVIAAVSMLERNPAPDEAAIREGLACNLCRCTGYTKTFEAVIEACKG